MSHSHYVCNVKDRTCFDLSSNMMTDDFESLCRFTCLNNVTFDDFLEMSDSRMLTFDVNKIRELYEYIQTIPPAYFEWTNHEDDLMERVFDSLNNFYPIEHVGSLYNNCNTLTFTCRPPGK